MNDAVRKITPAPAAEPLYREAPNNIERSKALLGAILVNNDRLLSRVGLPEAGASVRAAPTPTNLRGRGRYHPHGPNDAKPRTIKTFLPADDKVGDLNVAHTWRVLPPKPSRSSNAEDYGRAIYDLALRAH